MPRAFVVGNGPSLKPDQLDKLIPEVSFGVNRIHLIYDQTKWRPDYWIFMDFSNSTVPVYKADIELHSRQGYPCYVRSDIVAKFIERYVGEQMESAGTGWNINAHLENIKVVEQCPHIDAERHTVLAWHLPGICKQGGSVSGAIQLAVLEGYNPIYLIGCDGNMKGNAHNHFTPDYVSPDAMTVEKAIVANKTLELAHQIAGRECKQRGISIFNATVGGTAIGGIPPCDFFSLFD
jgi:hypothetical protein